MRETSPSPLRDLWNEERNRSPWPKDEEAFSDKLCIEVRKYFQARAVIAEREVVVSRRIVSGEEGKPGSRVDVFLAIPAAGGESSEAYCVPIEVKLSGNASAKAALKNQLVDRYMSETGARAGAYVAIWLTAPDMAVLDRPQWLNMSAAVKDLEEQACTASKVGGVLVEAIVVDCSLP